MNEVWDCVVVGGGAAGLSAALVLGRARRRTLLVDAEEQSNRAAPVIGGLLGHDQRPPSELYAVGRRELAAYPSVEFRAGTVRGGTPITDGFRVELNDGADVLARRVLLTTGMRYSPPEIPGLAELWGTSVFQCPFCHGWEMRDKRLAVLASRDEAVHDAVLLRAWTDDVVLLTNGPSELDDDKLAVLRKAGVELDERRVVEVVGRDGALREVVFADHGRLARDGILVEAPLRQRSSLASEFGVDLVSGSVSPDQVGVDAMHRTNVPDVFAAGDVCAKQPHVPGAVDSGSKAAMTIIQSLLSQDFGLPFPPLTAHSS